MSVEVVKTRTFERIVPALVDAADREHVTSFFYRHPERFRIVNFTREAPALAHEDPGRDVSPGLHLAVDTPEQFDFVARVIESMERPHWEYSVEETLRLAANCLAGAPGPRPVLP
jgi:spore coat polysaccharide biosynthesis protein SpsF